MTSLNYSVTTAQRRGVNRHLSARNRAAHPPLLRRASRSSHLFCGKVFMSLVCCFFAFLLGFESGRPAHAKPVTAQKSIDTKSASFDAEAALKEMHRIISKSRDLEFQTSFHISRTVMKGTSGTARFFTRQPNLFRVEVTYKNKKKYIFVSDGKTLTIHLPNKRKFAQVPARDSIVGTMYFAAGTMMIQARVVDFFWTTDFWATLGDEVRVAAIGRSIIKGRECNRIGVHRFEDKWEVWLEKTGAPLPCKLVSRKTDGSGLTVQTNEFHWNIKPEFPPEMFVFTPPQGSRKVDFSDIY
jgi:hypothetical protein